MKPSYSFVLGSLCAAFGSFLAVGCSSGSSGTSGGGGAFSDAGVANKVDAESAPVYDDLVVFTSKATVNGDLGGLTGADDKCTTYAHAAGLSGTFRAWLSDTKTDAISRVPEGGPWRVLDASGRQADIAFADRQAWTGYPKVRLEATEFGKHLEDFGNSVSVEIPYTWTGTALGGKRAGCACADWTSSANGLICGADYGGVIGSRSADPSSEDWTKFSSDPCDTRASLLCFQIPE